MILIGVDYFLIKYYYIFLIKMNQERINELKEFVEDFDKKLEDSYKRYTEVILEFKFNLEFRKRKIGSY